MTRRRSLYCALALLFITDPARAAECGKEWQRACCPQEGASCEPGLVETQQCMGPNAVHHTQRGWKYPPLPECACEIGTGWSNGECIDDTKKPGPVGACWLNPDPSPSPAGSSCGTPSPPPPDPKARRALSLYVAGFNHDNVDIHRNVRRVGLDELFQTIVDDRDLAPEDLVVAFSEAGIPDDGCDPGPFANAGPYVLGELVRRPRHAECLANLLQNSPFAEGKQFRVTEWDYFHGSTVALVTGERWTPVKTHKIMVPVAEHPGHECKDLDEKCLSILGVRLRGAAPPYNDVMLPVYVVHLEDAPMTAENLKLVTAKMHELAREGDLPPLLVGDFNSNASDGLAGWTQMTYAWANNCVACNGAELGMENDILHVFAGRPKSAQFPEGFAPGTGFLSPLRVRYSVGADGLPLQEPPGRHRAGIYLPHSNHNVIAMDFAVAFDPLPTKPRDCNCDAASGSLDGVGFVCLLLAGALALGRRQRH